MPAGISSRPAGVETALRWVLFAILNSEKTYTGSAAIKQVIY